MRSCWRSLSTDDIKSCQHDWFTDAVIGDDVFVYLCNGNSHSYLSNGFIDEAVFMLNGLDHVL